MIFVFLDIELWQFSSKLFVSTMVRWLVSSYILNQNLFDGVTVFFCLNFNKSFIL